MLHKILKRLIEKGVTDGLSEKLDVFYATDKISKEEYDELTALLNKGA